MDTLQAFPFIYGKYEHKTDDKNRFVLPAGFYEVITQRNRFNLAFNPKIDFVVENNYIGFKIRDELLIASSSIGQDAPDRIKIAYEADINSLVNQYYLILDGEKLNSKTSEEQQKPKLFNALDYFLREPIENDSLYRIVHLDLEVQKKTTKRFSPELYNELFSFYKESFNKLIFEGRKDYLELTPV